MVLLQKFCCLILLPVLLAEARPNCRVTQYEGPFEYVFCMSTNDDDYVLRRGLVSDNRRTMVVLLKDCKISHVNREAFKNMPVLQYIDLSSNHISELPSGIFDGNIGLKVLNISYNSLTELPIEIFDQTFNLTFIDLQSNQIKLEAGIFDSLRDLLTIDLSNNSMLGINLSPNIFRQNEKLSIINFSNNYMNGTPYNLLYSIKVLESLHLANCFLSEVPLFARRENLRTLKHLSLNDNKIRRLKDSRIFENLFNLQMLDLANNGLEYINVNTFKPLFKLKSILMFGNKLSNLPDALFQDMPSLEEVDLSNNQLSTLSVNSFRGSLLKKLNLANNRITYLSDNFCQELIRSGLPLNTFGFYNNPWQCSCLKMVLDEVKKFNIAYNGKAYDGRHPVCVTTNEFTCKRHLDLNGITLYTDMYNNLEIVNEPDTWFKAMSLTKDFHF